MATCNYNKQNIINAIDTNLVIVIGDQKFAVVHNFFEIFYI